MNAKPCGRLVSSEEQRNSASIGEMVMVNHNPLASMVDRVHVSGALVSAALANSPTESTGA